LDKSDIGLDQVDNTSDANKPISTATQTALNERVRVLICDRTKATITGTTADTPVKTYLIPGGTLTGFAKIAIEGMGIKANNTGGGRYGIWGGTSPTFSTATATELRRANLTNIQYFAGLATFDLRDTNIEGVQGDVALPLSDIGSSLNAPKTAYTYNRANDYYIHIVFRPNSTTETYGIDLVTITAFREKNTI
jgi:hypothetical protein